MLTNFLIICAVTLSSIDSIILNSNQHRMSNYCYTTDGKFGKCIVLKECKSLYEIQQSSLSSRNYDYLEVVQLLRKSHCGYDEQKSAKVCCPEENSLFPDLNVCGTHTEDKIYGGTNTKLDEFPWVVLLNFKHINDTFRNGRVHHGTLINSRYVVTAEHLFKLGIDNFEYFRVLLGEYDRSTTIDCFLGECAPLAQWIDMESVILRDSPLNTDNIALIRLSKDVLFSDFIKPICLPIASSIANKNYEGRKLYISGWGLKSKGVRNEVKQKIRLPVLSNETCSNYYGGTGPGEMCIGGASNPSGGPYGVFGAPLMSLETSNGRKNWYFIGFNHMQYVNASTQAILCTRIAYYVDWIKQNARP